MIRDREATWLTAEDRVDVTRKPTSNGPALMISAHCSFFKHLLSNSRVDVTGVAPGLAVAWIHFCKDPAVCICPAVACTGFIPPPVTNTTGFVSSCSTKIARRSRSVQAVC